jgi:S-adenosylmethionine:tRNA ribosyltransferase-isomerase
VTLAAALFERLVQAREPPEARGLARDEVRMLVATRDGLVHARARDLPGHLRAGDILVVNTSATLPAALPARRADGMALRLHLSTPCGGDGRWVVELRDGGARFAGGRTGERLGLPGAAHATLLAPYLTGARLWLAALDTGDAPLLQYLAEHGAAIRYAYVEREWPLADYQTVFATQPGSAEMPSAGRPLTDRTFRRLRMRGIRTASVLLHCGLSSPEGNEAPYAEWFSVPVSTVDAVRETRGRGGRVVAIGTTVVRALESAARTGRDHGWTALVVTPEDPPSMVDGLLTGWHPPEASHLRMLAAIADPALLHASYSAALDAGYLWHEFGDVHLLLP